MRSASEREWRIINTLGVYIGREYDVISVGDPLISVAAKSTDGKLKWGAVDYSGKIISNPNYDSLSYSSGIGKVSKSGQIGFIDASGQAITPLKFTDAGIFGWKNKLASVTIGTADGPKSGCIDRSGKVIIPFTFNSPPGFFTEGLAPTTLTNSSDTKWGFIDESGRWAIKPRFTFAFNFFHGYAVVVL